MERYYISHMSDEVKEKNMKLWGEIRENGKSLKGEWSGDYWISTYEYNNKIYELWINEELGIMSRIVEYEKEEYNER